MWLQKTEFPVSTANFKCAKAIRVQIFITGCSRVLIHTGDRTNAVYYERTCPRFHTTAQDSNPGYFNRHSEVLATAPLRRCAAAPLRRCAAAPLRRCAAAPLRRCAAAPLRRCAAAPLRRCAAAPLRRCAAAPQWLFYVRVFVLISFYCQ